MASFKRRVDAVAERMIAHLNKLNTTPLVAIAATIQVATWIAEETGNMKVLITKYRASADYLEANALKKEEVH